MSQHRRRYKCFRYSSWNLVVEFFSTRKSCAMQLRIEQWHGKNSILSNLIWSLFLLCTGSDSHCLILGFSHESVSPGTVNKPSGLIRIFMKICGDPRWQIVSSVVINGDNLSPVLLLPAINKMSKTPAINKMAPIGYSVVRRKLIREKPWSWKSRVRLPLRAVIEIKFLGRRMNSFVFVENT